MAASRAPHPLAEAIVDLAFPQRQSSYILLQLRHCAGGVDIAVHGGSSPGMAEEEATLMAEGELFSVPATPAGLAAFAEELATLGCWLDNFTGGDIRLGLPEEESPQHAFKDWRAVNIRLLAPQFVRARRGSYTTRSQEEATRGAAQRADEGAGGQGGAFGVVDQARFGDPSSETKVAGTASNQPLIAAQQVGPTGDVDEVLAPGPQGRGGQGKQ
ncbi:hypothetical protein ABPG75_007763 [Micractinium tetrahymenae]